MKIWHSPVCGCKVEEIDDADGIPRSGRPLSKCQKHAEVADEDLYTVLVNENRAISFLNNALLGQCGVDFGLHETKTITPEQPQGAVQTEVFLDANGLPELVIPEFETETVIEFKPGITLYWAYSGNGNDRRLKFVVKGATLTNEHKTQLAALCDEENDLASAAKKLLEIE